MTNTNIVKTLGLIGLFTLTACATNTQAKSLSPQAKDAVLAALDDEYKAQSLYK